MSSKNTWITLVAGLFLAICLWGLSSYLIPSPTTAYRVDAQPLAKVDQGLMLTPWTGSTSAGNLDKQLVGMRADLVKARTNYDAIKSGFGWTESFDNLLAIDPSAVSAKLPSALENTDELDLILGQPDKLKVVLLALPIDQWIKPKAAEDLGGEWVWVKSDQGSGFWIYAKESADAPKEVKFRTLVNITAVSPSKDQWLLAHEQKLSSVQNMDDGKAEYLSDGTVIGVSKHLIDHPVKDFNPYEPLDPDTRKSSTIGKYDKPKFEFPDFDPPDEVTEFGTAKAPEGTPYEYSKKDFERRGKIGTWNSGIMQENFKKEWIVLFNVQKKAVAKEKYNNDKDEALKEHQNQIEQDQKNLSKEDSFAYRWILLP